MGSVFSSSDNQDIYVPRKVKRVKTKVVNEEGEEEEIISYRVAKRKKNTNKVVPTVPIIPPFGFLVQSQPNIAQKKTELGENDFKLGPKLGQEQFGQSQSEPDITTIPQFFDLC